MTYDQIQVANEISIPQTIDKMRQMVDNYTGDLIEWFDWYEATYGREINLRSFYEYIKRLPYIDYGGSEVVKRQKYTLMEGGDCDQKAILLASYFRLKYPEVDQFFKAIMPKKNPQPWYSHVYNQVCFPVMSGKEKVLPLDATYDWNKFGKEVPHIDFKLFLV